MAIRCWMRHSMVAAMMVVFVLASAQEDAVWAKRFGGPGSETDQGVAVAVDASGNTYVAGNASVFGGSDYAVVKYSPAGAQLWVRTYDGPAAGQEYVAAIAVDPNGNVVVTGSSEGVGTNWDVATVKYSPSGQQLWVRRYDGQASLYDNGTAVACDANGNVAVAGTARTDSTAGYDYVTIKYGPSGNVIYTRLFDAPNHNDDAAKAITFDASGSAIVVGSFHVVKYDVAGVRKWIRTYEDPNFSEGWYAEWKDVATDGSGNVYVTGNVRTLNYIDYITVKYDTNGVRKWLKTYDGPAHGWDGGAAIVVDAQANVYVTGKSQSEVGSYNDYATIKYNTTGTRQWVKRYDWGLPGPYNCDDVAYGIALSPAGGVCVAGTTSFIAGNEWVTFITTLRYEADGNQKWVRHYPTPHPSSALSSGVDIAVNASGNPLVVGTLWTGPTNQDEFLVVKYGP